MIDHLTYHVPPGTLNHPELLLFMKTLGLIEIPADDPFEHGWEVRWFRHFRNEPPYQVRLHLVQGEHDFPDMSKADRDELILGHFCISGMEVEQIRAKAREMEWLDRDSGSGRIWLRFANLRVEVRP